MEPSPPIYLDYNATTPVDPRVLDRMLPYFTERFGNAASRHSYGQAGAEAVSEAREQVAGLIGANPGAGAIVFTSGATESDNLAVRGAALAYADKGRHIITAMHEHLAVVDPCRRLEREGFEVTWLRPGADGLIRAEQVDAAMRDDTTLVSIMWANNEIGTINDIPAIGRRCRERGVLLHTDATQFVGKMHVDVEAACVDLLSATAHKYYGPKGCGFLYVRDRKPRVRLEPILEGGGHEGGMRSGTLNIPGIVGLGAASAIAKAEMDAEADRLAAMRDRLEREVTAALDGVTINSPPEHRLPHVWHVSFDRIDHTRLMEAIGQLAVSAAAACHSGDPRPSYVLKAIGLSDDLALASVRFSLGRYTTDQQISRAIVCVTDGIRRLRGD
jgi:cysteine desulfurase